jgi:MarR family transcriptional regulator for hemolysin
VFHCHWLAVTPSLTMLDYDFQNSIGYWLITTHQAYLRALNEKLVPQGITFRQAQVLGWLAVEGPLTQTELASRMLIEPPTLVGILDRAEQAGLIKRLVSTTDRRSKEVHLLPGAATLWEKIVECGREMRSQAINGLSPQEIETLIQLLEKVRNNVSLLQPV